MNNPPRHSKNLRKQNDFWCKMKLRLLCWFTKEQVLCEIYNYKMVFFTGNNYVRYFRHLWNLHFIPAIYESPRPIYHSMPFVVKHGHQRHSYYVQWESSYITLFWRNFSSHISITHLWSGWIICRNRIDCHSWLNRAAITTSRSGLAYHNAAPYTVLFSITSSYLTTFLGFCPVSIATDWPPILQNTPSERSFNTWPWSKTLVKCWIRACPTSRINVAGRSDWLYTVPEWVISHDIQTDCLPAHLIR